MSASRSPGSTNPVGAVRATVLELAAELAAGRTTSVELTRRSLDHIAAARKAGSKAFTEPFPDSALAAAHRSDQLRRVSVVPSLLAGIPMSIKDVCDVEGHVTRGASLALNDAPPAVRDADAVARLRRAGAIFVGKTNMSEFAIWNTGTNEAFGTPGNPVDPARLPGGSSSGAAVSVADGSVPISLGSDTGGSVRMPAALCGVAGFKPSEGRVPTGGIIPVSTTFDTLGPLARSVTCCAIADAVLADVPFVPLPEVSIAELHLGLPSTLVTEELDSTVSRAFERTLQTLSRRGARISEFKWPDLVLSEWRPSYLTIVRSEEHVWHHDVLERGAEHYERDPRYGRTLGEVFRDGERRTHWEYVRARESRQRLVATAQDLTMLYQAVIMPTTPIVAPLMSALDPPGEAGRLEGLIGRNTELANFFGFCGCTVPCHRPDELPVGLMVMGLNGTDRRVLTIAAAIERMLREE